MVNFWQNLPRPIIGLSPMDGVTDAAFRRIVAMQGRPDVTFTEFTSVGDICRGPDFLLFSLQYSECERPVVAQLYGKDPDLFYRAAQVVCELGFDGLDINMGCPSKNVAASGSGAGLIRTPDLAHAVMRAARHGIEDWANGQTLAATGLKSARIDLIKTMNANRTDLAAVPRRVIPLSVKTRLGYDSVVVERWVSHLLEERPAVISIHGRTLAQMYRGEADWQAIARAVPLFKDTGTLVLGNGDVQTMRAAVSRVRESGVHGVLVGRGVLGSPWFFRIKEAARAWAGRTERPGSVLNECPVPEVEPDLIERFRMLLDHARQFEGIFGIERFPRMRKHLGWYCKGFPHAAAMRAAMVRASSSADVQDVLEAYLGSRTPPDNHSTPSPCAFPASLSLPCA
ncbi:MAG: tRNA dihydrouridine synthase [Nitrospiraceae bacterium]